MGKRSDFERKPRDFYPTPYSAVVPLLPYIGGYFVEPCAGNGALVNHLTQAGLKVHKAFDIEPQAENIEVGDALTMRKEHVPVITNPPWDRHLLHPMIERFREATPHSWLLIDADWMHTKQSSPYMKYCSFVIAIGRVKWIEGSAGVGKDNCCWYRFEKNPCTTIFIGR